MAGGTLRGHTFHYSTVETPAAVTVHTQAARGGAIGRGEAVYVQGPVRASYFHAWFPSSPVAAARLFLAEDLA